MTMGTDLKDQAEREEKWSEDNAVDLGPAKPVALVDEDNVMFEAETVFMPSVGPAVVDDPKSDVKSVLDILDRDTAEEISKVKSDGSTASYYELPEEACELQHLISFKDMNAQMGEIFRAVYRYGQVEHSEKMRDAKKIKYYIEAEIERLEKYSE